MDDRYSIKNMLFTKAIPNYVIPVPTTGYKVFACLDCGDKFMLESSLQYHVSRKSLKISYLCRLCNKANVFFNRCNLLAHIRAHTFKTATINVTDLKIEPLPSSFFKKKLPNNSKTLSSKKTSPSEASTLATCSECKANIPGHGIVTKITKLPQERAKHYMKVSNETFSCPICLFNLPTKCAYKAHLRFHFRVSPFICPECGFILQYTNTGAFPFGNHSCEGFQMMRTSARVKCPIPDCHLLTLAEYKDHLINAHLKELFKCSECYFACIDETIIKRHVVACHAKAEPPAHLMKIYQCQICLGKLVPHDEIDNHVQDLHVFSKFMFPCWICGEVFERIVALVEHQIIVHDTAKEVKECYEGLFIKQAPNNSSQTMQASNESAAKKMYGVVKRCDQCMRSFSYRCPFDKIPNLPNECPYKCTAITGPANEMGQRITCHICKNEMSQNWVDVKKHFKEYHKSHRCLDIQVPIARINIDKYLKNTNGKVINNSIKKRTRRKRNKRVQQVDDPKEPEKVITLSKFACRKCDQECENKELLEKHLLIHRDLYMAYQCMECGQSFVVKPSFTKHLLLEHDITNVDEYINEKKCYNEDALQKYQNQPKVNEPLQENQCKICRLQFVSEDDFEKHFRVHGMAFLMKNNSTKNI